MSDTGKVAKMSLLQQRAFTLSLLQENLHQLNKGGVIEINNSNDIGLVVVLRNTDEFKYGITEDGHITINGTPVLQIAPPTLADTGVPAGGQLC